MSVATNLLPANTSGVETDTSGWTAGANTTLSKSARFYQGASSLGMTATAAGSVTATTSARVAVVAGREYMAYSFFANVAATSGRVSTVRVDWYAAVSGGTVISSVTSAGATLPNATTWTQPPPILIAKAPVGAAYASVTVTVTGLTAGATVVTDSAAIGPPALIADNLLPYGTQSVEVDTTGWVAGEGVTLTRSSASSYEGWYSLQATSTVGAGGSMFFRTGPLTPVVAGTEYISTAWVNTAHAGVPLAIQIAWLDDAGVSVGARATYTWTPAAASTWTRLVVIGAPPAGATQGRTYIAPQPTAVGQTWLLDQVVLRPSPMPAGSLIGYNTSSIEVDASGWTAVSGCTISRSTERAWEGAASLKIVPAGGADATVHLATAVRATPRQSYTGTTMLWIGATASDRFVTTRLTWQNAAGEDIWFVGNRWRLSAGPGGWYSLPSSSVAPDDAASFRVTVILADPVADDAVFIDDVKVVQGGVAAVAEVVPAQFGVTVALQGLTTDGHANWGLWRADDTGAYTPIRGTTGDTSQADVVGDAMVVEDYEAPLGVPITYTLKLWTDGGSSRSTTSNVVVIPEPPPTEIVLKDPGLPARQTTAVVAKGGAPTWTRKARQSVNAVRGRARPIVISDMRTSREGTLTLVTETEEDLAAMWWLLETGNVLLIQWPHLWGEKDVYVSVGDVSEAPVVEYAGYHDRTWTIPLTEVDRPIGGATGSADRTWQTLVDEHDSWSDVLDVYSSWLGVYTGVGGT